MVKGYYRMISGVDNVVGRLRKALADRGLDRNTIIILMGDNGYFLGERGLAGKWLMYEPSLRVPLIVYDPRAPKNRRGRVLDQMALNIDVPPTILSMAGLPMSSATQGRSLMELLKDAKTPWRTEFLCEHLYNHPSIPQSEGVRTEKWKYFRYREHPGFEELYHIAEDPMEEHNLASDPAYKHQLETLRQQCDQLIAELSGIKK
jgi:arylsulfatase A-like enzyme